MKELKLLIVEDDSEQIITYQRDIKSFNLESQVKIKETILSDKKSALKTLEDINEFFDAAIVDLRLDEDGKKDFKYSGNEVLKKIKGNLRFPVFVVTGTPQNISEELKEESVFFRIKTRGEEDDYLEQLVSIYNTGITNILGRTGEIEKYLNNIFWKHLSKSMDMWISDQLRMPEQKEKSLLRYTFLHMQEYIDEDIDKYHPSEFYIINPIKSNIFTGDIVKYDNGRYVVLTPSCDIIIRDNGLRNTQKIMFCKIINLDDIIEDYASLNENTGKNNSTREKLCRLIENKKQNFHFIPRCHQVEAGLIDFQDKLTLESKTVDDVLKQGKMKRIATISAPFLKDIISRYSSYYSRQGSPDFNTDEIYSSLFIK